MKSNLYLVLSILLGLYLVYISFNVITESSGYDSTSVIWLLGIYLILGSLEFVFIKKYKKYANPEYKRQIMELKTNEQNARKEAFERTATEEYEKQKNAPGSKTRMKFLEADLCIRAKHMTGLPIAESAEMFLYRAKDKVIFERNQDTFELEASNMKDILIKTDIEIQKSYVSSVGGAVGGYVLFGPLGAMVGGRSKEKKSTTTEKYLIFDYIDKDGIQDFISFEVTNESKAILFNTNHYDLTKNERTTVVL